MAAAPYWKVYDANGKYQSSCHQIEAAAALMAFYGGGATIRKGHNKRDIVWTEGVSGEAWESYDNVAEVVYAILEGLRANRRKVVEAGLGDLIRDTV